MPRYMKRLLIGVLVTVIVFWVLIYVATMTLQPA
jgi:hypothetical protein